MQLCNTQVSHAVSGSGLAFSRDSNFNLQLLNVDNQEMYTENCEYSVEKTQKEEYNNTTRTQYFYKEKWIYVHKESTKERHGYCTLGEAFNRLDFSSAIQDIRRFNYVVRLLQLIAKSELTSLSGAAQKNYFNILEKIVAKDLKEVCKDLSSTLCILIGRFVLVGNMNTWINRLENILLWQQQLMNLHIKQEFGTGLTLSDLPLHMQNNILCRFSDAWDIINLGQLTPTLRVLTEDPHLWKKLCKNIIQKRNNMQIHYNFVVTVAFCFGRILDTPALPMTQGAALYPFPLSTLLISSDFKKL
ncbi:F-box only 25 isoform X3 [Pelobates cultripes]|uniref:F-box only protein 25 n=1 Tax=Pelobates cultripes TaxID=61616 RepID=A0AAD1VRS3_PELCU|nr:F-box only 25 isoform X3 [Pelobates cultripes]